MHTVAFVVAGFVIFALGYAFRGAIRRDIAALTSEGTKIANRLEAAAKNGEEAVVAEAGKIVSEVRARL